jgi:hypothetical protein
MRGLISTNYSVDQIFTCKSYKCRHSYFKLDIQTEELFTIEIREFMTRLYLSNFQQSGEIFNISAELNINVNVNDVLQKWCDVKSLHRNARINLNKNFVKTVNSVIK